MQFFFRIKQNDNFKINITLFTYWLNTKTINWLFRIIDNDFLCICLTNNYTRTDALAKAIKKKFFDNEQIDFKEVFNINFIKDENDLGKCLIKYFINETVLDNIDITIFKLFTIVGYSKSKLLSIIINANLSLKNTMICCYCSKKFSSIRTKTTHENKSCIENKLNNLQIKNNNLENENKILKEKIKNDNHIINITNNITQNNITNNNINLITKKDKLNHFYKDTIDMDTFIEKYKTVSKYQLTYEESDALLTVLEHNYNNYSSGLFNYLKNKYSMVFNDINQNKEQNNIKQNILPFILSDATLRTHYEKNQNSWNIVKNNDNIKKLITESNNQVYNHHNKSPLLTSSEIKKISNSILRESTDISKLDFDNQLQNNNTENNENNQTYLDLDLD